VFARHAFRTLIHEYRAFLAKRRQAVFRRADLGKTRIDYVSGTAVPSQGKRSVTRLAFAAEGAVTVSLRPLFRRFDAVWTRRMT